jgi:UDP-3-O-[3-hydroxymyristoyl] glucosamine N-acyltransferase
VKFTLNEIARLLNVEPPPDGQRTVSGVNTLEAAGPDELSFLGSEKYLRQLRGTRAVAVIVSQRVKVVDNHGKALLVVPDADLAVARVLERFAPPVPAPPRGVDPTASVHESAELAPEVAIGPNVVIGARARIGRGCVIDAGVVISDEVTLGEQCRLFPNVVIRERITIGNRVTIHAGSVLGTDGFGYRWDGQQHAKVPQIGTVIVEDDVEIGSCVCIDRAKFSVTRIGRGTRIDNLVQIAHNVQVGEHCIIVAQVGIAGSATLGRGVVLGGQSALRDHITIGDGAIVAACSAVMDDVEPGAIMSGFPAFPHRQSLREHAAMRRLPDLVVQVRKLQDEIEALKKARSTG